MRPLSFVLALAATASGVQAANAQDRYSARGVVFTPAAAASAPATAAPQSFIGPASPAPQAYAAPRRMLSWPGKVSGPQQAVAPAGLEPQVAAVEHAPAPVLSQPGDRYASITSQPRTDSAPNARAYAETVRAPAPRPEPIQRQASLQREAPIAMAAPRAERTLPSIAAEPAQRQTNALPQNIYAAPAPAQQPARVATYERPRVPTPPASQVAEPAPVAPAPHVARAAVQERPQPVVQATQAGSDTTSASGAYPPATKEPWRRLLREPAPAQGAGVAIALPAANEAPATAVQPKAAAAAPVKSAKAPAKVEKKTAAAPTVRTAESAPAVAPVAYRTAASTGSPTRFYSVHRQFGVEPDPIKMPQQFFLDGSPDLSEPPPPPLRRIPPTSGQSTAALRAAQERSQQNPDSATAG